MERIREALVNTFIRITEMKEVLPKRLILDIDATDDSVEELEYIITSLRVRWPKVRILVRGDSGFCRDYIMSWCEDNKLAKNERLKKIIGRQLYAARKRHKETSRAARVFTWFWYKTKESWRQERRVIAKAEYLDKG